MPRLRKPWVLLLCAGLALAGVGAILLAGPLFAALNRGQADQAALHSWTATPTPLHGGVPDVGKSSCGSSSTTDYALLTFQEPAPDHYAGVAGNGHWDLLDQRSMVHYAGTPDPGQQGNVIIAFHREPDFEHIDKLAVGDRISIQSRSCQTFVYQVTKRWILPPSQVTQLTPTQGHDLTLITCDPWWQDYNRLVWRAALISAPAPPGGTSPQAAAANPSF